MLLLNLFYCMCISDVLLYFAKYFIIIRIIVFVKVDGVDFQLSLRVFVFFSYIALLGI